MTFVKWGMAAALALAFAPAYADHHEMTEAKQEAQEKKAEAQKEASETKAEAQRDMSEAKADAQKEMSEAEKKAHEKTTEADREAREKTAEANKEMREETTEAQKDMAEEGREVRASDDRAGAMGTGAGGDADKAPLSKTAQETLKKLHASSQMEVGMARIAKEKAENEKVKDLAEKIQDDHSSMQEKASEIARERNVELATHDEMSKNRKHVEQMEKMQGAAFDKHYADMMAQEHKKEIAELRKAQTKLRANKSDEKVAELVDDALPKLEEHQKMALEAQTELRGAQRQGRRGATTGATSPSSTDASDTRTGAAKTSDQMGNDARPRDAVHGTENKEGTPTGSSTSDGSSDKKY